MITINATGDTTLHTAGKYCEEDILVKVPAGEQATPEISVSSNGLITATAGTKSATHQLAFQPAKTITPTTTSQIAVSSGYYTGGDITVSGDTNLVAENIAEGVNIFGVTGTHSGGSGGGGGSVETCSVTLASTSAPSSVQAIVATLYDDSSQTIGYLYDNDTESFPYTINNVVKGTVCALLGTAGFGSVIITGEAVILPIGLLGYNSFVINGDCTITANPCYAKNTHIILADRTSKLVQDITYQDELLVWDFDNGCISSARPIWIKKVQTADYYYRCEFANGTVLKLVGSEGRCHRIFDIDKGIFESATECVGHRIMTEQGETTLLSCERVDEEVEFYNIITHTHLNLYAESILTSCRLNNIYPIENMRFVKDNRVRLNRNDYPNIGSDMFRGLRISEQTMSKDEIDTYVDRLYSLMDYKPRYFVDDHTGTGNIIELTEAEYFAVTGTTEVAPYASKVYRNKLSVAEVPTELQEAVQAVVDAKIKRWGEYSKIATIEDYQEVLGEFGVKV